MKIKEKINSLGLELPTPIKPIGTYCTYRKSGNQMYFSGQGPLWNGKVIYKGKVGRELTLDQGYEAARLTALNVLAQIEAALGDLDNVVQFVNVIGFVNCTDDFKDTPKVINGFSDLIIEIFGDAGYHARCAVPSGTLPMSTPVEIQAVVEVK